MAEEKFGIKEIFPCPVYVTRRDSNLDSSEKKEIEDIIEEGMHKNVNNLRSDNSYIFNTKLKKIKEFCEQHIQNYVKKIIDPREDLDFYITQSWLNVTKPGESHHSHNHPNSIISGVFYVSTVENDKICFFDPNKINQIIQIPQKEFNYFNSDSLFFDIANLVLLLFSSSIVHSVEPNEQSTTDRISISFNTFAKGTFGDKDGLSELVLL